MTMISTIPSASGGKVASKAGAALDQLTGALSGEGIGTGAGDFATLIGDLTGDTDVREKADETPEANTSALGADVAPAGLATAGFVAAQTPASIGAQDAGAQSTDAVGTVGEGPALPSTRAARASTIVLSEDYAEAARRALTGTETDQAGEAKLAISGDAEASQDAALKSAVAALTVPGSAPRATQRANGRASAQAGAEAQGTGGTNANLLSILADTARNDNSNSRQGSGEGKQDGERRFAPGTPAGIGQALSDIVGSLPPIVQTQIGLPGASAIAVVQQANAAQALDAQVIDMGVSGQWIDRMAQEISTLAQGTGQSRFTLMPPHLGRIEISLSQSELSTAVHFATETDEAADRIRAAQGNLQADARLSALSIGSITVEKSQQNFDQATRDNGAGTGQSRQGADSDAQAGAQSQSGGQGALGRESKTSARRDVNHLSEAPEQARREQSVANPGVRFA